MKLIVAFAIIISRLEVFASRQPLVPSFFDALGMGLGSLIALVAIGSIRELLGNGSLAGAASGARSRCSSSRSPAGGILHHRLPDGALQRAREREYRERRRANGAPREGRMARTRLGPGPCARGAAWPRGIARVRFRWPAFSAMAGDAAAGRRPEAARFGRGPAAACDRCESLSATGDLGAGYPGSWREPFPTFPS